MARLTTGATDSEEMFRSWQYPEVNQSDTRFWPLLALQPRQQSAIFSRVIIVASLIMCSQLGADLVETSGAVKSFLQYTQTLSRSRTSSSNQGGIFHLFATEAPYPFTRPVRRSRNVRRLSVGSGASSCLAISGAFSGPVSMSVNRVRSSSDLVNRVRKSSIVP